MFGQDHGHSPPTCRIDNALSSRAKPRDLLARGLRPPDFPTIFSHSLKLGQLDGREPVEIAVAEHDFVAN